jgi:hypothetical protein
VGIVWERRGALLLAAVARSGNSVGTEQSSAADRDAVRALAAYKDFFTL